MTSAARHGQVMRAIGRALTMAIVLLVTGIVGKSAAPASRLDVLRLDYASYNPISLLLRRLKWRDELGVPIPRPRSRSASRLLALRGPLLRSLPETHG